MYISNLSFAPINVRRSAVLSVKALAWDSYLKKNSCGVNLKLRAANTDVIYKNISGCHALWILSRVLLLFMELCLSGPAVMEIIRKGTSCYDDTLKPTQLLWNYA